MDELIIVGSELTTELSAETFIEPEPEPAGTLLEDVQPEAQEELVTNPPPLDSDIDLIEQDTQASVPADAPDLIIDQGETSVVVSGDVLQTGESDTPETLDAVQPETVDTSQIAGDVVDLLLESYEPESETEAEYTFDDMYQRVADLDDYFKAWEKEEYSADEKKPIIVTFFDRSIEHYQLMETAAQTQEVYNSNIQSLLIGCLICLGLLVGMQAIRQLADFFR